MSEVTKSLTSGLGSLGLPISEPGGMIDFERLESTLNAKIASSFFSVYSFTDGFSNYHHESQILLWSLDKIYSNNIRNKSNTNTYVRIGDFLMESDYIVMNISDDKSEIKLEYEGRILSKSLCAFIEEISSGKFNFL